MNDLSSAVHCAFTSPVPSCNAPNHCAFMFSSCNKKQMRWKANNNNRGQQQLESSWADEAVGQKEMAGTCN